MILISDKILLSNKKDVILIHLYIKSIEKGVVLSEGIRSLLFYIYELGGINDHSDFLSLVSLCVKNTSIKTEDSVRNTISKCVSEGIIKNTGKYKKEISVDWLPALSEDVVGLDYKIMNNAV